MNEVLDKLRRALKDGVAELSADETQMRPAPDKWTIQQIVEHLLLSYRATNEVTSVRVEKQKPTAASPSLPQRLGQFMIATCGIFPKGRLAPPAVTPPQTPAQRLSGQQLAEQIEESLLRMDQSLTAAEKLFGRSRRAISHIVLGPMSVSQWRSFHLVHGQHHLKQIAAIRRDHGIPAATPFHPQAS